jgi:hypothetical protein
MMFGNIFAGLKQLHPLRAMLSPDWPPANRSRKSFKNLLATLSNCYQVYIDTARERPQKRLEEILELRTASIILMRNSILSIST